MVIGWRNFLGNSPLALKFSAVAASKSPLMKHAAIFLACLLTASSPVRAAEPPPVLYVQVVWGTNQERPAGMKCPEIGPNLSAKLSPVFRWKHYFENERYRVDCDPKKISKVPLAHKRTLEIEYLKTGEMKIRLFCNGKLVTKARQSLDVKEQRMTILGGEDANKDSFFVVVRADEPKVAE